MSYSASSQQALITGGIRSQPIVEMLEVAVVPCNEIPLRKKRAHTFLKNF